MKIFVFDRVEKIEGEGENVGYKHLTPLKMSFQGH